MLFAVRGPLILDWWRVWTGALICVRNYVSCTHVVFTRQQRFYRLISTSKTHASRMALIKMNFNKILWPSRRGRSIGGGRDEAAPTACRSCLLAHCQCHIINVHV